MIDFLRLCRVYYCLPMASILTLTACYARGGRMDGLWLTTLLATAGLAAVVAAAYVANDAFDVAADRVNAPTRPVAAGRVRRRTALTWSAILLAAGLILAAAAGGRFLIGLAVVATGLAVYNAWAKSLGVGKQLLAAGLMTSVYPLTVALAGWPTGSRASTLAVFPAWLMLTAFGYELLKDLRDAAGDLRARPDQPTSLQRNPKLWRTIASISLIAGALLLLPQIWLGCRWLYAAIIPVAILLAAGSARVPVRRAIPMIYAECVVVGIAATADVVVLGF